MKLVHLLFICLFSLSCSKKETSTNEIKTQERQTISCNSSGCKGSYWGPEFINGEDIAHQFSNAMSKAVGDQLKENYNNGLYSKVNFSAIEMSTKGMGGEEVNYILAIPFIRVEDKCDAYTSFDHVGGWNHKPALEQRKQELTSVLLDGEEFFISELKTTPEGLQEYWIQWKNKITQAECEGN